MLNEGPPYSERRRLRDTLWRNVDITCAQCSKENKHTCSYLFCGTLHDGTKLTFCNIDCLEDWEDANWDNFQKTNRRAAVQATRAKT